MKKIGKYQIFSEIQRGPITHVYKAVQTELQRVVLLKQLNPEIVGDAELLGRFKQEGLVLAKMKSPNVITIFDFGEEDGIPFLVTEFIEGDTLAEIIGRNATIPWDVALFILRQLSEALAAIHDHQIIHQDIKPENIFISSQGDVKLGDLGFSTSLKNTGTEIQGTPAYLPPELVLGSAVDFRSDLYSLGIVGYEMLTGENPFAAETMHTVLNRIVNLKPMPPGAVNRDLPGPFSALIEMLISKNPADRVESARELNSRLDQLSSQLARPVGKQILGNYVANPDQHQPSTLMPVAAEIPVQPVGRKKRRATALLVAGLILALIVTLVSVPGLRRQFIFNAADSMHQDNAAGSETEGLDSLHAGAAEDSLQRFDRTTPADRSDAASGGETIHDNSIPSRTDLPSAMKTQEMVITSDPRAFVFWGEDSLGITPVKIRMAPKDTSRHLEFRNPVFPVIRKHLSNYAQSVQIIHIDLWREVGYLQISVVPWGEIWIDGDSVDISPIPNNRPVKLTPGLHELMVRHPQLDVAREQVFVAVGETLRKNIYLQPRR
ncbi:MAG: serine/threonine protein kinase [Candidatus Zhuqueibacterota bacterium]